MPYLLLIAAGIALFVGWRFVTSSQNAPTEGAIAVAPTVQAAPEIAPLDLSGYEIDNTALMELIESVRQSEAASEQTNETLQQQISAQEAAAAAQLAAVTLNFQTQLQQQQAENDAAQAALIATTNAHIAQLQQQHDTEVAKVQAQLATITHSPTPQTTASGYDPATGKVTFAQDAATIAKNLRADARAEIRTLESGEQARIDARKAEVRSEPSNTPPRSRRSNED